MTIVCYLANNLQSVSTNFVDEIIREMDENLDVDKNIVEAETESEDFNISINIFNSTACQRPSYIENAKGLLSLVDTILDKKLEDQNNTELEEATMGNNSLLSGFTMERKFK